MQILREHNKGISASTETVTSLREEGSLAVNSASIDTFLDRRSGVAAFPPVGAMETATCQPFVTTARINGITNFDDQVHEKKQSRVPGINAYVQTTDEHDNNFPTVSVDGHAAAFRYSCRSPDVNNCVLNDSCSITTLLGDRNKDFPEANIGRSGLRPLPKPVLTTLSQEENPKRTVTSSIAIDEEFIFEEPSDDLSNLTTLSSISTDGIQYLFSPPQNRKAMKKCSDLPKASSSLPFKENKIFPKFSQPKEMCETPPAVPALNNIWATTVARDKIKCNVCMVPNSKGATKCVSCESPLKVEAAAVPKVKSIWDVNTSDFIKCSVCMVQNSKTAVKCVSCESPLKTTSTAVASSSDFPSTLKAVSTVEATNPASSSKFIFGIKSPPVHTATGSATSSQPIASEPFVSVPIMSSETAGRKVSTGFIFGVPAASTVRKAGSYSSLSADNSKPFQTPPAATAAFPSKLTLDYFPKSCMRRVDAPMPLSAIPQFWGFSVGTTTPSVARRKAARVNAKPNEDVALFSQATAISFGVGNSSNTSNFFGCAFQSSSNQPQHMPFGGSGSLLGMFGCAPLQPAATAGAFGGFTTGAWTGMVAPGGRRRQEGRRRLRSNLSTDSRSAMSTDQVPQSCYRELGYDGDAAAIPAFVGGGFSVGSEDTKKSSSSLRKILKFKRPAH